MPARCMARAQCNLRSLRSEEEKPQLSFVNFMKAQMQKESREVPVLKFKITKRRLSGGGVVSYLKVISLKTLTVDFW